MIRRLSLVAVLIGSSVVVVAPAAAGGGCHAGPSAEVTGSAATIVHIAGCAFQDTVTYVDPGERVTWINKDPAPHTVTGALLSWGDEVSIQRGGKVSYTFEDKGVYPYYCAFHPAMVGAVVVGDPRAMLGSAAGTVEKVDLAGAAAPAETEGGSGTGTELVVAAAAIVLLAAGGALFVRRTTSRRRARAASAV